MTTREFGQNWFERTLSAPLSRVFKHRRDAAKIAPYLDAAYYLDANKDVARSGIAASLHYAKYGWREGRDPSPSFSTKGYMAAHPSVALSGQNPLLHFVETHRKTDEPKPQMDIQVSNEVIDLVEQHLDAAFYARELDSGLEEWASAALHYCQIGWLQGLDPSAEFSTSYYLTTNPDVAESGVNPFWHYLVAGREEGRIPLHPGGWRHKVLSDQTSFEAYSDDWRKDGSPPDLLSVRDLKSRLSEGSHCKRLIVSIGHDDYRNTPGGVQLCIEIEEQCANASDWDYLNLHPWQPWPRLAGETEDVLLNLVLNNKALGTTPLSTLTEVLSKNSDLKEPAQVVIHHLSGHSPEGILKLAQAVQQPRVHFWLHDYFSICTSYALQRNNVMSCDAPSPGSNACDICLFGCDRTGHIERFEKLFKGLDTNLIAPSEAALSFWQARTQLPASTCRVHPHMQFQDAPRVKEEKDSSSPFRIAFVGTPAPHKGWHVFQELRRRLSVDPSYEFWFFGQSDPGLTGLNFVPTHVRAVEPDGALRALASNNIDLVLHWAAWRETFSLSTFEAIGAGAFVLTNSGSGNVAATVTRLNRGQVYSDADALFAQAKQGALKDLANQARLTRRNHPLVAEYSNMTLDMIEAGQTA